MLTYTCCPGLSEHASEAVNPVALGKARAKQYSLLRDAGPECMLGDKVMSVQLHGDAVRPSRAVAFTSV